MNRMSIKLRVTLWYVLVMSIISGIALCGVLSVSRDLIVRDTTTKVKGAVNDLSRKITGPRGDIRMIPSFQFFDRGVLTAVYDSEHNLVGGSVPFEFIDEIEFVDNDLQQKTYNGDRYLSYVKKVRTNDGNFVWIKGVISMAGESQILQSVGKTNLIITLILICAAAVGGYMIIRHALKPVDKISKTAKEISESSDLSQRIAIGKGNDEIYRLANTFDAMLDKIEKTLENEKQFTSDASHELRTPVAVITSECEYVLDCVKTLDEAKESVTSIKRQSDKMSKLISELLTISRMDKNTQKTNFEDVDVSELLSFVCDEQVEIHDGSISLIRNIKPDICARADRFLITRLFINLISNAYQYGRENGTINVTLDEDMNNVIFSVADDGIGIDKEHLSKIWERFYQVDSSRTNESGSMGLGLAMVKWIVECHKGRISVNSEFGKGSVFTFVMPKK